MTATFSEDVKSAYREARIDELEGLYSGDGVDVCCKCGSEYRVKERMTSATVRGILCLKCL
jgi:hypothetical protein